MYCRFAPNGATLAQIAVAIFYLGAWTGAHAALVIGLVLGTYALMAPTGAACASNPSCEERAVNSVDLTAEKLNHVFGNSEHALEPLLQSFNGNQVKAFNAVSQAFSKIAGNYSISELGKGIPVTGALKGCR